jgi:hypothetical protein
LLKNVYVFMVRFLYARGAYRPPDDSSGASATSNATRGVCRVPFSMNQAAGQARSRATARSGREGTREQCLSSTACRCAGFCEANAAAGSKTCCRIEGVKS